MMAASTNNPIECMFSRIATENLHFVLEIPVNHCIPHCLGCSLPEELLNFGTVISCSLSSYVTMNGNRTYLDLPKSKAGNNLPSQLTVTVSVFEN